MDQDYKEHTINIIKKVEKPRLQEIQEKNRQTTTLVYVHSSDSFHLTKSENNV